MMAMFLWMGLTMIVAMLFTLAAVRSTSKRVPDFDPQPDTILAIDDDPEFLNITKLALEHQGYHVHAVTNPTDGIHYYERHRQSIGLVLLDYFMPQMNGDQVFAQLREVDPHVPVLLVTGASDRVTTGLLREAPCGYLPKPFRFEDLLVRVNDEIWPQPVAIR
ncbi:MAG: Regulator of RpoS [Verrucomicrobiae bacterium]|nr:Regulator of RpoS [Verrucomicrobiae bacterium]